MTMEDLWVWLEWFGDDSIFYRKKFPFRRNMPWHTHVDEVIKLTGAYMIYKPLGDQPWGCRYLTIVFFNRPKSELSMEAIAQGAHEFAELIKADLLKVYVGDEYGDLKFECSRD